MIGSLRNNFREGLLRFRSDGRYRELIRSSFFALVVRIAGVGTGFLVTLFTSRYFGADALGVVSICMAILSIACVISKLGLDIALLRDVSAFEVLEDYAFIKSIYLRAIKIIIPFSLLVTLVLYLSADWMATYFFHKSYMANVFRINAIFNVPLVLVSFHSECLRGLKKISAYSFYATTAASTLAVLLLITAIIGIKFQLIPDDITTMKFLPVGIQFAAILLAAVMAVLSWFYYSRILKQRKKNDGAAPGLLRTSLPIYTSTLMQLVMSWAPVLILGAFWPEASAGIFNAMVRISVVTNIAILAVNSLSTPRFAVAFAGRNFEALRSQVRESTRLIFFASLPIFAALCIFPGTVLSVFGKDFPGNEWSLELLLAGQFIAVFCGLPTQVLTMTNQQYALCNIAVFSAIVNVGSCYMLIPRYGIQGASLATILGTFSWNMLCVFQVKRKFGFYTWFVSAVGKRNDSSAVEKL